MKKLTLIIAMLLVCSVFTGCGDKTGESSGSADLSSDDSSASTTPESDTSDNSSEELTIGQKTQQLLDEVEFPSMVEVSVDNLSVYYGIDEGDITEFSAYLCGTGAAPDEFGIFSAASDEAAERIKSAVEKRIESQRSTYADYPLAANDMYKFDDCFVSVSGTTVIYAICADNTKASEILG